jgi:PAS domain S-box-containing protein
VLEDLSVEKTKAEVLVNDLRKFKLALDNVSDHVTITDKEGIVVYVNNAVEKITGYSPMETIGKKAGILWKLPMSKEYYQNLWHTIKGQKKIFMGEIQNRRKNGQIYTAMISISPVLDDNGDILFFVGLERDITLEKKIDQAKTEFISLASHQLRTPLTAISWYTEMLLAGDVGKLVSAQKKYLEEIHNGSKRMIDLVNTLLNVSHFELGTFNIKPEQVKLKDVAESVLLELKPQIIAQNLTIDKNYDPALPVIFTDLKLVRIIIENLLSNAVKYVSANGKITFDISVQESNALITVWNNGMAIPKEAQPKIFTKLFRDDLAQKKDPNGNGLGLYIVKTIVENFGGKIYFKSEKDKGTAFYVILPLAGVKKEEGKK